MVAEEVVLGELMLVVVILVTEVLVITVVIVVLEVVLVGVFRVVAVLVVTIGGRALVCAGAVIDTFVEVLTVAMRVDMMIVVSEVAVGLLMDALTDMILGVLTSIGVEVLVDVNVNVFAGLMTALECAMPSPLEKFRCRAAFGCLPMAASGFVSVLQAWMPSYHV